MSFRNCKMLGKDHAAEHVQSVYHYGLISLLYKLTAQS